MSTLCYSSHAAFVSVVSAFRVHFLTFIDNYTVSQRSSSHALCFRRFGAREYNLRRSFPLCPRRLLYLGAKL